MKRLVSFILIITVTLLFLLSNWFMTDVVASEGYWKLETVTFDVNADTELTSMTIEQGYATYWKKHTNSGDVFAASGSWTPPAAEYRGGETIRLTLSAAVETYVWNGKDSSGHLGLNFMGYYVSARLDAPGVPFGFAGNNSTGLRDSEGQHAAEVSATEGTIHQQSTTREVSAEFRGGYRDGEQICLYISASHTGHAAYCYTWVDERAESTETTAPADETTIIEKGKTISLSGIVTDVEHNCLPHMKVTISYFYDAAAYESGELPSAQTITHTDLDGRFFDDIIIPADHDKKIGIQIKGTLTCVLGADREAYYFTNMTYESSKNDVSVASFITIDPTDQRYKNKDTIHVARMFSFYYLISGTWSYDLKTLSYDPLWSNVPDHFKLAATSYLYRLVWDAQLYGAVILGEASTLKQSKLKIETDWVHSAGSRLPGNSHFDLGSGDHNIIRLIPAHSCFNDQSRFMLLHEYGHFFDMVTNSGQFRATSLLPADAVSVNHGGYLNDSTADSFEEAFASAFAIFVQTFRKDPMPHIGGGYDFGTPGNYVAWRTNGKEEEFAIAALLYQMYGEYKNKEDFWQILKPNRADFYAYYQAFEDNVKDNTGKLGVLENAARQGGLYTMPFGDGLYNKGEPFLDKAIPGTAVVAGQYDLGEMYGDLMFAVSSTGWIDENQHLQSLPETLVLGKTSDALRNRQTIEQLENSYLHFDDLPVDQLLIRVMPDKGDTIQNLVSAEDNKVYLHLVSRPQQGKVEVVVPGGDVIYSGDLAALQQQLMQTTGQVVPLAEITTADIDWPDASLWPAPSYGDPDSQTVLKAPDTRLIRKNNDQAVLKSSDIQKALTLSDLFDLERQQTKPEISRNLIAILVSLLVLLVLLVLIVLTVRLIRKQRDKNNQSAEQSLSHSAQPGIFCPNCGVKNEAGHVFCENCGSRLWR